MEIITKSDFVKKGLPWEIVDMIDGYILLDYKKKHVEKMFKINDFFGWVQKRQEENTRSVSLNLTSWILNLKPTSWIILYTIFLKLIK